jgi:RNA polymerase sigma-70 factor, ECF subfamily
VTSGAGNRVQAEPCEGAVSPDFAALYSAHFDFVWRNLRRLGVPPFGLEDAVHDVFVVVQRRLGEFEGRCAITTWLFAIALRVAQHYRRVAGRCTEQSIEDVPDPRGPAPDEAAARQEALRMVEHALDALDDDRRAVFVLAELEQMPAKAISEALGVGVNTVHSRLRLARRDFERAVQRARAHGSWREKWLT